MTKFEREFWESEGFRQTPIDWPDDHLVWIDKDGNHYDQLHDAQSPEHIDRFMAFVNERVAVMIGWEKRPFDILGETIQGWFNKDNVFRKADFCESMTAFKLLIEYMEGEGWKPEWSDGYFYWNNNTAKEEQYRKSISHVIKNNEMFLAGCLAALEVRGGE